MRASLLAEGKIAESDLALLVLCDSPAEVRDMIVRSSQEQGWRGKEEAAARAETERVMGEGD